MTVGRASSSQMIIARCWTAWSDCCPPSSRLWRQCATDSRPCRTAARLEPDLLVLDIAMPGLNGIAAAARLKESGSTAKVVFVTNLHDREFVQESLALGEVGFVVKDRLVADLLPGRFAVSWPGNPSSRRPSAASFVRRYLRVTSGRRR